jgi:hypothetical protein
MTDHHAASIIADNRRSRWTILNDPRKSAPTTEPALKALLQEIRSTVDQEAQIIQAVFPMKEDVMRVFLQRVFAQVVREDGIIAICYSA